MITDVIKKNFPAPKTKPRTLSIKPNPLSFENFLKIMPDVIISPQNTAKVTIKPRKLTAAGESNLNIASLKKVPTSLATREPMKIPPTIPIRPKSFLKIEVR